MELTFGEQIMILLKRRNMTIQDLATLYEQRTGNKMSRQNLTQRLKRDNFPEQDMHVIGALLGYNVSVQLTPITVPLSELVPFATSGTVFPAMVPTAENTPSAQTALPRDTPDADHVPVLEAAKKTDPDNTHPNTAKESPDSAASSIEIPEIFRKTKPAGDINPLTGEEYLTNTVRRHPDKDDYIQVYDQKAHSWSDVRENYFWEFQQRKKQVMGRDYQEPILI